MSVCYWGACEEKIIDINPKTMKTYHFLCMNCNFAKGVYGECPHQCEVDFSYGDHRLG